MRCSKNSKEVWSVAIAVVLGGFLKDTVSGIIGFNYNYSSDGFYMVKAIESLGLYMICYLLV